MGLGRVITLQCRFCRIEYSGETVVVVPLRWWFQQRDRQFRIDGQWPLRPVQAFRRRYWRRSRIRVFSVSTMAPVILTSQQGRWPRKKPATLRFADTTRRGHRITVPVTPGLMAAHGETIERINRAIAEWTAAR